MLFHEDLRSSIGIDLDNRIIIIDEAHNVVEAINQLYSSEISLEYLQQTHTSLQSYISRFQLMLHGKNLYYLNLLQSIVYKLLQYLQKLSSSHIQSSCIFTTNEFLFELKLDNINFLKLCKYITITNLENRVGGYADHYHQRRNISNATSPMASTYIQSLRNVIKFLQCLMRTDVDGRINVHVNPSEDLSSKMIKFILFNPSKHFKMILDQAQHVLLLGGTMKPFHLLTSTLFPHLSEDMIQIFSCDHVVASSHVNTLIVPQGFQSMRPIEFTHEKRHQSDTLNELFHILYEYIAKLIEHGVVVFFSSYAYMELVVDYWKMNPNSNPNSNSNLDAAKLSYFDMLHMRKPIFLEPKSTLEGERVLERYSQYATSKLPHSKGAMLLCVMGGKLSEGINFSDDLARCVVVVGLPYPDIRDMILQERMKYADSKQIGNGRKLYESLCMKQVNQSIGRSIRHKQDYATIVLFDRRYESNHVMDQLPSWITRSISICRTSSELTTNITSFMHHE